MMLRQRRPHGGPRLLNRAAAVGLYRSEDVTTRGPPLVLRDAVLRTAPQHEGLLQHCSRRASP